VCGGELTSNGAWKSGAAGAAQLDLTILDAEVSSNGKRVVSTGARSFGTLKIGDMTIQLRADGEFGIGKPYLNVANVFSGYGDLKYRCYDQGVRTS